MISHRLIGAVVLVAATVAAAHAESEGLTVWSLGAAIERASPSKGDVLTPREHQCVLHEIACGQTISSNLTSHDCLLSDGTYVDFFLFFGQSGQGVTIDLRSSSFDPVLFLLDPTPEVVAFDDDSGTGNNARIVYTLDQTSPDWAIAVNTFFAFETGPYTLELQCSGGQTPPPEDGFFSDPNYPDFRFRVTIDDTRAGAREPSCLPETVCVSGALPGRSEAYIRILGPRPNGYLWPTIIRFTPARLVVEIRQLSSGQTKTYELPAVPAGVDELSGLQDRTGFLP